MKLSHHIPLNNNQQEVNFGNITFYTKNKIDILTTEDTYEIAHVLKHNYENNIDNSEYLKKLKEKNLDTSFLKNTLIFMISRGIPQATLLQKDFNIDTSDINIEYFIEGFKNGINGLENSELLIDFIDLYKNKQELLERIGKEVSLTLLFELVDYYGLEFIKFNDNNLNITLNNFEKNIKKEKLLDKINKFGFYDWYYLSKILFNENISDLAYNKIQETFNLTEQEKYHFEELKQSHFFLSYQEDIQEAIEYFQNINLKKISKFTFNDTHSKNNNFQNKLQEIIVGLNYRSVYSIVFIDISGQKIQFNIGNQVELLGYNYNLLEKENFFNHISEEYGTFKLNLSNNNMDFTIMIFKESGDKNDIPDEEDNTFLIAA